MGIKRDAREVTRLLTKTQQPSTVYCASSPNRPPTQESEDFHVGELRMTCAPAVVTAR